MSALTGCLDGGNGGGGENDGQGGDGGGLASSANSPLAVTETESNQVSGEVLDDQDPRRMRDVRVPITLKPDADSVTLNDAVVEYSGPSGEQELTWSSTYYRESGTFGGKQLEDNNRSLVTGDTVLMDSAEDVFDLRVVFTDDPELESLDAGAAVTLVVVPNDDRQPLTVELTIPDPLPDESFIPLSARTSEQTF